jgi:hypothetical protein
LRRTAGPYIRVKSGKVQTEHKISALPLKEHVRLPRRHVRKVPDAITQKRLVDRAIRFAATWNDLPADDVHAFVRAVTARVQVHAERIEVALDRDRLLGWLDGKRQDEDRSTGRDPSESEPDPVVISIPVRLKRAGKEMRLVVDDGCEQPLSDSALIRLVIRAHGIRDQLLHDRSLTLEEIAKSHGFELDDDYMGLSKTITFDRKAFRLQACSKSKQRASAGKSSLT